MRTRTYLKLFTSTFYISAFTFGGGFVIIPLLRKKFVDDLGWLQEEEMMDLAAIAQSSPGPIAVNASILIGHKVAGIPGALCTCLLYTSVKSVTLIPHGGQAQVFPVEMVPGGDMAYELADFIAQAEAGAMDPTYARHSRNAIRLMDQARALMGVDFRGRGPWAK